jgi:hypothetical protein
LSLCTSLMKKASWPLAGRLCLGSSLGGAAGGGTAGGTKCVECWRGWYFAPFAV